MIRLNLNKNIYLKYILINMNNENQKTKGVNDNHSHILEITVHKIIGSCPVYKEGDIITI